MYTSQCFTKYHTYDISNTENIIHSDSKLCTCIISLNYQTKYNHICTTKLLTDHLNHVLAVHPAVLEAWFFQLRYLCVEGQTGLGGDVATSQVMTTRSSHLDCIAHIPLSYKSNRRAV